MLYRTDLPICNEPVSSPQLLIHLLRIAGVSNATGFSRSLIYERIAKGLFPHPLRTGARLALWPSHEIAALNRAIVAGKSDQEIRMLVTQLEAARAHT
jgi:prophage regulatory protein